MALIDIVTIVYQPEVMLLKLQARSMAMFLEGSNVGEIVIIVQGDPYAATLEEVGREVLDEYGLLRSNVRVVTQAQLMPVRRRSGWAQQQALKLLIARDLRAPHYVVLDAKNHFIRPVSRRNFISADGRVLSHARRKQHPRLAERQEKAAAFYQVDLAGRRGMPTTTPFTFIREKVCAMLDDIESREGQSFANWFLAPGRNITEFFLYYAYLCKTEVDIENLYHFSPSNSVTFFRHWPGTQDEINVAISKLSATGTVVLGLHRERLAKLDESITRAIVAKWLEASLFNTEQEARVYLDAARNQVNRLRQTPADLKDFKS